MADPVHLVEQHSGVGWPLAAVPGGGPRDQRVDVPGNAVDLLRRRRDVLVDVLVGDLDRRLAFVRLAAGEQLVEHHAGGIHVRAGVGATVDHELRRHVGDGADQDAAGGRVLGLGADRLRQPEVGDLDPPVVRDEDVLGLDVAMDQAGAVGRREGGQHRLDEGQGARRRHRALLADHVAQGVAGDVLHGQEDRAVVGALVVDGHHVGVGQPGGSAGLAHEPGRELLVVAQALVHDLDGHHPVQPDVGGFVDAGHATAGDADADPVAAVEDAAGHGVADSSATTRAGVLI